MHNLFKKETNVDFTHVTTAQIQFPEVRYDKTNGSNKCGGSYCKISPINLIKSFFKDICICHGNLYSLITPLERGGGTALSKHATKPNSVIYSY